jgi:outer membrane protein assembly factor BamB
MIEGSERFSQSTRILLPAGMLFWVLAMVGAAVAATCPPSCPATGGGPEATDCHSEFASPALRLNYPPFNPADPQPRTEMRCFDGDVGCDTDGATNGVCVFDVDVCLRNDDPALPSCTPADVTSVQVTGADGDPDLQALQGAIDALLPATSNVCTSGQTLRVPLTEANEKGTRQRGSKTVELTVQTAGSGTATDRLELSCVPRGWPTYGYDHANHRSNPTETIVSPENASQLQVKWVFDLNKLAGGNAGGVTSTPTVGNGLVYVTTWKGTVYALDPDDGSIVWSYQALQGLLGLQSSATLTADGRLLVGDSAAILHCLDALTGELLWKRTLGDVTVDHIWASPQVANGRVFMGIASHADSPCTLGRLIALDLDTGEVLWTLNTIPEKICRNDTSISCEDDTDCGEGGECIPGKGAGVTATVAVDPTGDIVYMNTVGCFTFPSIGDSESIFKVDAATGAVIWKNRVEPPEQFGACENNGATDCRSDADCDGGVCKQKPIYHDFGFLNGPVLIDTPDGEGGTRTLVVSGSKHDHSGNRRLWSVQRGHRVRGSKNPRRDQRADSRPGVRQRSRDQLQERLAVRRGDLPARTETHDLVQCCGRLVALVGRNRQKLECRGDRERRRFRRHERRSRRRHGRHEIILLRVRRRDRGTPQHFRDPGNLVVGRFHRRR